MINDLSKPGLIARKIEDEGLVEDRVQRSLLHVRLLLRDPLTIVHQVDLHVRICKKYFRFLYIFLHFFWPFWMLDYWKNDTGSNFIKKNCISLDLSVRRVRYEFFCFFLFFLMSLSWSWCCQEWFLWDCEENVRNTNLLGTDAIVRDYREPCTVTQTREDKSQ